ncbi:hypothetical protein I350_07475 [Cryptococcus amylolentus CBS 6273]|uniref:Uncharacterized protein n=1 Tax=Cryptococcus amylolentus CBS 6273 TaxID=1296118 RepID=A0A1E3JEL6_9TREE|nr:hypothetical protein I350_07475 [Cryptococcus amylolentus CBS 6273]
MPDNDTNPSSQPRFVIPTGTEYKSGGVSKQTVSLRPRTNETITLNTEIDYDPPHYREDGETIWEEPLIRPALPPTRHPSQAERILSDIESAFARFRESQRTRTENEYLTLSYSEMYNSFINTIESLYGDVLGTVEKDLTQAMSFAAAHIAAEDDDEVPAYTENEVKQITARLARTHVISILKNTDIANEATQVYLKRMSDLSKIHMDRTILGSKATVVWDDHGARMMVVTGKLLEPNRSRDDQDHVDHHVTDAPPELVLEEDTERQSWAAMNNCGSVVFEDANGAIFDFGFD